MEKQQYICPKCGCREYIADRFQAVGGGFAKLMDIQNKRFVTVSCKQCGYTELYRGETETGMNILDFLIG